ncbi:hypothetical protein ABZS66_45645 [Dactylosporangium sp. NPDC005572]|uniref:hypothetical protein n=1 Tax=Dactylosporangium sp. NPDC005572 TaxID=3156889 RepID=UPI0033B82B58
MTSLARHLGSAAAAEALRQYARHHDVEIRVPAAEWLPTAGYTGAVVRRVALTDLSGGPADTVPAEILVKVCPPDRLEGPGHRHAWRDCPEELQVHLVAPYRSDWPARDGSILALQQLAGGGAGTRLLSELPDHRLLAALDRVVRWVITGWNRDTAAELVPCPVRGLLTDRLAGALLETGSIARWARRTPLADPATPWLRLAPGGPPLPNPLWLTTPAAPALQVRARLGRTHHDLHLDNVILPVDAAGAADVDRFQLIDLATYRVAAPLTLDPVTLLLATLVRHPAGLDAALLAAVLDPEAPAGAGTPFDAVRVVRAATAESLGGRDTDVERSWQVSVVGGALLCTTFDRLPPAVRWWCFTLACHAADRLLGGRAGPGGEGPLVTDPFAVAADDPPPRRPTDGDLFDAARLVGAGDLAGADRSVRRALRLLHDEPALDGAVQVARLAGLRADAGRLLGDDAAAVLDVGYEQARAMLLVDDLAEAGVNSMEEGHRRSVAALGADHPTTLRYRRAVQRLPYS